MARYQISAVPLLISVSCLASILAIHLVALPNGYSVKPPSIVVTRFTFPNALLAINTTQQFTGQR